LGVRNDQPPITVLHPRNHIANNDCLVIDGNHRVAVLQELSKEDPERFGYVNAVIMSPDADIRALERIGEGILKSRR